MSEQQNLSNHTMLDPKFHYFLIPVSALNFFYAIYLLYKDPGSMTAWTCLMAFLLIVLIFTVRIYSLRVQDRLIRLEERLRMQRVLPESVMRRTAELTEKQYVALRFASDEELSSLVETTLTNKLKPADIKKAVKNWRPDNFRV
jgi:hypothetical protein